MNTLSSIESSLAITHLWQCCWNKVRSFTTNLWLLDYQKKPYENEAV